MRKQCPQDYSKVAYQYRKTGDFKYLTSPILAVSRCGDFFGPHRNYCDMPKDFAPTRCYQHSIPNSKYRETASCHEIHRNLRAASRKSSILIPDTASEWYANQRKFKKLLTNFGQLTPEEAFMAYRQYLSQSQSLLIPPPLDRLNIKPPIRHCTKKKAEESVNYMSPEFMELLREHNERLKELHNLNALPGEYGLQPRNPKISRDAPRPTSSLAIRSRQSYRGGKIKDRRRTSLTKRSKKVVSELALLVNKKIRKSSIPVRLPAVRASKSKLLQVIWEKPNALEMRRSESSVHLPRKELKYGTGMQKEGAMRKETSTSDEETFPLSSSPKPRKFSLKALRTRIRENQLKMDDVKQREISKSKRKPKRYSARVLKTRIRNRELQQDSNAPVKGAKGESTQKSYRASTSNRKRTSIAKLRMLKSNWTENRPLSTKETLPSSRSGQSPLSKKPELRKSPSTLKYRLSLQQITDEKSKKPFKPIWKKPNMGTIGQSSESFKHTLSEKRSMQGRDQRSLRATRKKEASKDSEESPHSPLTKKNDFHRPSR